jgi:hypothetical protein
MTVSRNGREEGTTAIEGHSRGTSKSVADKRAAGISFRWARISRNFVLWGAVVIFCNANVLLDLLLVFFLEGNEKI